METIEEESAAEGVIGLSASDKVAALGCTEKFLNLLSSKLDTIVRTDQKTDDSADQQDDTSDNAAKFIVNGSKRTTKREQKLSWTQRFR